MTRLSKIRKRSAWPAMGLAAMLVLPAAAGCRLLSHNDNVSGMQLYQQGSYEGALLRFQNAVDNDPGHPDGFYNLAATHHRLWKLRGEPFHAAQAESFYRQALGRDDQHREGYRGLAVLLVEQGRPGQAVDLLNQWAGNSPTPATAKIELARLYQEFNDHEEALARIHEAIEHDPSNDEALRMIASIQEAAGDYTQALANYKRSLALNQNQPGLAARVALLQGATGTAPLDGVPGGSTRMATAPAPLPRY